jgi:adenylosuccinate lyase
MVKLWSDENKFSKWLEIELAVCEVNAAHGNIPPSSLDVILKTARFDINHINEIELLVKHDMVAFLTCVSEYVGEDSKYIHLGMTSSDVVDTSTSLLLRDAGNIIRNGLIKLNLEIMSNAIEFKYTPCIGRTHGVHAEPTTLGLKFLLWHDEIKRNISRLDRVIDNISVIKLSGAVGTFDHMNPIIEQEVGELLKLKPINANQVISRDLHADFISQIAIIGTSIEKFATEIRHLQRTEVREVEEFFGKNQKGSSAMPHKRNPIKCEQLAGLARILRSNVVAAMEDIVLWHERDISHSSVERIIFPDSTSLVDYMINQFTDIMAKLIVYPDKMMDNIFKTRGLIFSQNVMLALINKGMSREDAYVLIQSCANKVWESTAVTFKEVLLSEGGIIKHLMSTSEFDDCFNVDNSLKHVDYIFSRSKCEGYSLTYNK